MLTIVIGLYTTYALNVYVEETTPTTYDMAFNFDLSNTLNMQLTVEAGKTKIFDIDITNPYSDSVQYGVAYSMVSPTTLPTGVTIAQVSTSKNTATGLVNAGATATVSVVIANSSSNSVTTTLSVINGYKNGGDLIVPSGKTLITDIWMQKIQATQAVISLSKGNSWSSGASGVYKVTHTMSDGTTATDYRYVGANVNNYVWFNNDMYRIIGVFDENTHGVEGEYLVKLISANLLSANSWGVYSTLANQALGTYSNYANDWTGNKDISSTTDSTSPANANILLNQYFYNKTSTSDTYGECINWTYSNSGAEYRTFDCSDIVGYGIDSSIRGYIQEATWHLYGYESTSYSKQNFYLCERGQSTDTTNCMSGNSGTYDTSTTGYIGLMYASDYLYASGYYASDDTTNAGSGYPLNKNWLYKGNEWTITPDANSPTYAFYVSATFGRLYSNSAYTGYGVRPTFYLKSSVYVTGGTGTFDDPYTIACDDCSY